MPFEDVENMGGYDAPRSLRRNPRTGKLTDPHAPAAPTRMIRNPQTGGMIDADFLEANPYPTPAGPTTPEMLRALLRPGS